jgi:hypothetical protein
MPTVELRLDPEDLPEKMSAMRQWLDEHRCETSVFKSRRTSDGMFVSVVFGAVDQAEAFAERFAGRLTGAARPGLIGEPPEFPISSTSDRLSSGK